jgi:hypothetical protein
MFEPQDYSATAKVEHGDHRALFAASALGERPDLFLADP